MPRTSAGLRETQAGGLTCPSIHSEGIGAPVFLFSAHGLSSGPVLSLWPWAKASLFPIVYVQRVPKKWVWILRKEKKTVKIVIIYTGNRR